MKKILFITAILVSAMATGQDRFRDGIRTLFVQPDTLSTLERDNLSPKLGTMVYHKDVGISKWEVWNGTAWADFGGAADGVVTNVALSSNLLNFTGTGGGFNGSVDLSPSYGLRSGFAMTGSTPTISNINGLIPEIATNTAELGNYDFPFTQITGKTYYYKNLGLESSWAVGPGISSGEFRFSAEDVIGSESYILKYTMNKSGTPSVATDLVTKAYGDANYLGGGGTYTAGPGLDLVTNEFSLNATSQASLALADSAAQPGDNVSIFTDDVGYGDYAVQQLTEGANTGYRLKSANPANYGDIGNNAIDLGFTNTASTTFGATGGQSTVIGGNNNTASGFRSLVTSGDQNIASGDLSAVIGSSNSEASGEHASVIGGAGNVSPSMYEVSLGSYGTLYTPLATNAFNTSDRLFNIGKGTSDVERSDAFTILKSGLATLPSVTNSMIDASGTGKEVATVEWVLANAGGGGSGIQSDPTGLTGAATIANIVKGTQAEIASWATDAERLDICEDCAPAEQTTGTAIDLGGYVQYNMASANTATSYSTTNVKAGGYAEILINAASEPTVTGSTKLPNTAAFIPSTNMVLVIKAFGSTPKHYFIEY